MFVFACVEEGGGVGGGTGREHKEDTRKDGTPGLGSRGRHEYRVGKYWQGRPRSVRPRRWNGKVPSFFFFFGRHPSGVTHLKCVGRRSSSRDAARLNGLVPRTARGLLVIRAA